MDLQQQLNAIEELAKMNNILNRNNVNMWIDFGPLLCCYRDKNLKNDQNVTNEHGKEFNYLVFYCLDKDGRIIERIYIFPRFEIIKRTSIAVLKNSNGWCDNKDVLERANNIFQEILMEEI